MWLLSAGFVPGRESRAFARPAGRARGPWRARSTWKVFSCQLDPTTVAGDLAKGYRLALQTIAPWTTTDSPGLKPDDKRTWPPKRAATWTSRAVNTPGDALMNTVSPSTPGTSA